MALVPTATQTFRSSAMIYSRLIFYSSAAVSGTNSSAVGLRSALRATMPASSAVLVGQSESDLPSGTGRGLFVVAEAQRQWRPEPVLRDDARGVARRRDLLVRQYVYRLHRGCAVVLLREPEASRVRQHRSVLGKRRLEDPSSVHAPESPRSPEGPHGRARPATARAIRAFAGKRRRKTGRLPRLTGT